MDNKSNPQINEGTILDSNRAPMTPPAPAAQPQRPAAQSQPQNKPAVKVQHKNSVAGQAIGAGVGAVMGAGAAAVLTGMKSDDGLHYEHVEDEPEVTVEQVHDDVPVPVAVEEPAYYGNVPLAHGVSDNMSFAQAFSAARAEVGSGGVFHWHGQSYNTFTADEWNSMSHDQQMAFGQAAVGTGPAPSYSAPDHQYAQNTATHENNVHQTAHTTQTNTGDDGDGELEVLGVVHDEDTGFNTAILMMDGTEVAVVDVDGDMRFDLCAIDVNGDGEYQEGEIFDVPDETLTVASLGGFTDGTSTDSLAQNDEIDYTNDATI